jgi:poly-gamma-glutamate capsule biosynthesis protein CapA/YwtB (metallophosphatase superfamily)
MRGARGYSRLQVPAVAALVVSSLFLGIVWSQADPTPEPTPAQDELVAPVQATTGTVVDASGRPVPDAEVDVLGVQAAQHVTDAAGNAELALATPALVRVTATGYSDRVVAAAPADPFTVSLVRRTAGSLSLRFGGDVMMGRRFYEASDTEDAWLQRDSGVDDHAATLRRIQPLLADADLTIVNLETSLMKHPYFSGARPRRFHPDKDLVFASAPVTARALKLAGVDVVDLGNNHVYDGLAAGLDSTIRVVEAAGLVHFGAGRTPAEAWRPAYAEARGQTVGFVGCTTVTGDRYPITYVTRPGQGGAAECAPGPLRAAIAEASAHADTVVVMMHGGVEYQQSQDALVRSLSAVAADAGATLVVNGHPHVIGGFVTDHDALVAETLGNLLFDQNLWSTLRSYLLRVDLENGRPVRSQIDPFAIAGYTPVPTTGLLADASARVAAGFLPGPMLLGEGAAATKVTDPGPLPSLRGERGEVATLPVGAWLLAGQPGITPGQDLLYGTGSFEQMDTGPDTTQPLLWGLGKYTQVTNAAACTGARGVHLVRKPASDFDVIATPLHRMPVTPGERLTLAVSASRASDGAQAEVRWYAALDGPSDGIAVLPIESFEDDGCRQFRLDVTVPDGVVAVQPYLRLIDPGSPTKAGELIADDVRLVRWDSPGAGGRIFDTVSFDDAGSARLTADGR